MTDDEKRIKAAEGIGLRKSLAGWRNDEGVQIPTDIDGRDTWDPLNDMNHAWMLWEYASKHFRLDQISTFARHLGARDEIPQGLVFPVLTLISERFAEKAARYITEAFVAALEAS